MSVSTTVRIGASTVFAGFGTALLVVPGAVVRAVIGGWPVPPDPVVRVLGAQRIIKHLRVAGTPSRAVAWGSVGTDVLHAAGMVAAARIRAEFRRPELSGAGAAAGTAALTALAASGRPRGSR